MINIFYWLILIQAILILITFNISTNPQITDNILEYFNLKRIITNQCGNISICQDAIKLIESINIIEIQINYFQAQHFCYLFIYPLILILKQFNKERNFFRNMAFWFHWIQYPFLYLFVQKLSFIIKLHFPELIMPFNICFGLFILNLTFFIINQQFLGIGIQNKRKPLYILFFLLVLNLLYNIITVNNYNWIPYLMINAYIQIYLIHIDSNLFQNNQYIEHNKPLIKILFERISFLNRDHQKNRFVIKKDKAMFIFIIIPCILYFRETLLQSNVLFIVRKQKFNIFFGRILLKRIFHQIPQINKQIKQQNVKILNISTLPLYQQLQNLFCLYNGILHQFQHHQTQNWKINGQQLIYFFQIYSYLLEIL